MADVPGNQIDTYLDALEEPKRSTLARLRGTIMTIVPDAEQCISYGMPAFRLQGKTVPDSPPSSTTSVTCPTADR
jgi:uncharacterized protein YdhG (YjbR/CyaY superfamily)